MKKKSTTDKINVKGTAIAVIQRENEDFISLTDIAKSRNPQHPDDLIRNWLRNRNTLELLGIWEQLHNPDFNSVEFDGVKKLAGLNSFTLTPKQWIEKTSAIGIVSKTGRYGGSFAHRDLAFEFASFVSVEFKLYLIKEFQRLKEDENRRLSLPNYRPQCRTGCQPVSPGQGNGQPVSPGQGNGQPVSPGQGNGQPVSPGQGNGQPVSGWPRKQAGCLFYFNKDILQSNYRQTAPVAI